MPVRKFVVKSLVPILIGTGLFVSLNAGATAVAHFPGGMCLLEWKAGANDWEPFSYCLNYADIAPDEQGSIADLWFGNLDPAAQDVLLAKQLTRQLTPVEVATVEGMLADRPPSLYVVKAASVGSRPTYPIVDGNRITKSNGRIAVGEPCSCLVRDGDYCEVSTGTVALCAKR